MDQYTAVILIALFGFLLVAVLLLAPVYFFLKREERASARWTPDELAARAREHPGSNGSPTPRPAAQGEEPTDT